MCIYEKEAICKHNHKILTQQQKWTRIINQEKEYNEWIYYHAITAWNILQQREDQITATLMQQPEYLKMMSI